MNITGQRAADGSIRFATTGEEVGDKRVVYYCGSEPVPDHDFEGVALRHLLKVVPGLGDLQTLRAWLAGYPYFGAASAVYFAERYTRESLIAAAASGPGGDMCAVAILIQDGIINMQGVTGRWGGPVWRPHAFSHCDWFSLLVERNDAQ